MTMSCARCNHPKHWHNASDLIPCDWAEEGPCRCRGFVPQEPGVAAEVSVAVPLAPARRTGAREAR
jgi:hypothetical protein